MRVRYRQKVRQTESYGNLGRKIMERREEYNYNDRKRVIESWIV